jgi:type IV secretion system protein VirB5
MYGRKLLMVMLVGILCVAATRPAKAQWAVIDAANLTQSVKEVISWGQQLQAMTQQYEELVSTYDQLQSTYQSITGPRGMQNLLLVPIASRNYLPTNYTQMSSVINGTSTAYPVLASQVQSNIQTNAILTPQSVNGLSPQAQQFIQKSRQAAATLSMLSQQNQSNASNNFSSLQTLINALGNTGDTKSSADLSGRIQSEQVMTQTNQIKTDALYQSVQAQQLQNAQLARESAVKQQGTQAKLTAISW